VARTVADVHGGWAVAGGAVGLLAGTLLRPTARRLAAEGSGTAPAVDAAAPDASAVHGPAPHLPGSDRAASAGPPPGAAPRMLSLAPVTAVVLALLAGRLGPRPELPAFGWLAVVGVALAFVDVAAHRLPDALVLPAYPAVLAALAVPAVALGEGGRLLTAVAGSLALAGCYLVLVLVRPGQLGLGDLKLAGVLGLALGWLGWRALLAGSVLAFALLALCGLALLATGRVDRRTALPFGPFMLAAALLVVLAS